MHAALVASSASATAASSFSSFSSAAECTLEGNVPKIWYRAQSGSTAQALDIASIAPVTAPGRTRRVRGPQDDDHARDGVTRRTRRGGKGFVMRCLSFLLVKKKTLTAGHFGGYPIDGGAHALTAAPWRRIFPALPRVGAIRARVAPRQEGATGDRTRVVDCLRLCREGASRFR